jgi:predicted peptidase
MNRQLVSRIAGFCIVVCLSVIVTDASGQQPARNKAAVRPDRPGGAPASFAVRQFKADDRRVLDYSLFVPKNIGNDKLPLVLCLHGSGGNTEAASVLASPAHQMKHPCIIMAPRCDTQTSRWVETPLRPTGLRSMTPELMAALDALLREFPIDSNRVYVTGQSMGGVGTWGLIAQYPSRFAAAVPVCGSWAPADAPKMKSVPIWAFHGDDDQRVPVDGSRRMIDALTEAGAMPRYTEYPGVGHNSWNRAYATDELWDWLFEQRLKADKDCQP